MTTVPFRGTAPAMQPNQNGFIVTVDRPAAKGDFVQLDLTATIDGAGPLRLFFRIVLPLAPALEAAA